MPTTILYTDDGQWWLEGDSECYIKSMDVPESDWQKFLGGEVTMDELKAQYEYGNE